MPRYSATELVRRMKQSRAQARVRGAPAQLRVSSALVDAVCARSRQHPAERAARLREERGRRYAGWPHGGNGSHR